MQNDIIQDMGLLLQGFFGWLSTDPVGRVILITLFLLVVYGVYLVLIRAAKVGFKELGMPREAATGVIFFVRLVFFAIAFVTILTVTGQISGEAAVAITTLVGAAVGLASSRAIGSMVSGLYLFAARPFRVGDYVKIGDVEGIVLEITLNYTRLLRRDHTRLFIPNSGVVDSRVTNYRIRVDDYLEERGLDQVLSEEELSASEEENNGRLRTAVTKLKQLAKGDEIYRYAFEVSIEGPHTREEICEKFDAMCKKYAEHFVYRPEYIFWEDSFSGPIYHFAYAVYDPKDIFTVGAEFHSEVALSLSDHAS